MPLDALAPAIAALQILTHALEATTAPARGEATETAQAEQAAALEARIAHLTQRDDDEMQSLHEAVAELGVQLSGMRTEGDWRNMRVAMKG